MRVLLTIWSCLLLATSSFGQSPIALLEVPTRPLEIHEIVPDNLQLVPFHLERGMIQVEAALDGTIGYYILDTGAPYLVLNQKPTTADSPFNGQSCVSDVEVGWTEVDAFEWAGRTFQAMEAVVVDLMHLNDYSSRPIKGLIGYELLKDRALVLDYTKERLALIDSEQIQLESFQTPLAQLSLELEGHLPIIEVQINGRTFRFGIDTGAAANLIDTSTLQQLMGANIEQLPTEELQGLDQSVQRVQVIRIEEFWIDQQAVSDRFLVTDLSHVKQEGGLQLDGLLGTTFLQQFISCINYPEKRLSLWPVHSEL